MNKKELFEHMKVADNTIFIDKEIDLSKFQIEIEGNVGSVSLKDIVGNVKIGNVGGNLQARNIGGYNHQLNVEGNNIQSNVKGASIQGKIDGPSWNSNHFVSNEHKIKTLETSWEDWTLLHSVEFIKEDEHFIYTKGLFHFQTEWVYRIVDKRNGRVFDSHSIEQAEKDKNKHYKELEKIFGNIKTKIGRIK